MKPLWMQWGHNLVKDVTPNNCRYNWDHLLGRLTLLTWDHILPQQFATYMDGEVIQVKS